MTDVVHKVLAYITRRHELLVFEHVHYPEVGLQVPGGTLEAGESAVEAVRREVLEETGLSQIEIAGYVGTYSFPMAPDRHEIQLRHVYHLRLLAPAPDSWQHYEHHAHTVDEPILLQFFWKPLDGSDLGLAVGQGRLLPQLFDSIQRVYPE